MVFSAFYYSVGFMGHPSMLDSLLWLPLIMFSGCLQQEIKRPSAADSLSRIILWKLVHLQTETVSQYPRVSEAALQKECWKWIHHSLFKGKYNCCWNRPNKEIIFSFLWAWKFFLYIYWQKRMDTVKNTWQSESLGLNYGQITTPLGSSMPLATGILLALIF